MTHRTHARTHARAPPYTDRCLPYLSNDYTTCACVYTRESGCTTTRACRAAYYQPTVLAAAHAFARAAAQSGSEIPRACAHGALVALGTDAFTHACIWKRQLTRASPDKETQRVSETRRASPTRWRAVCVCVCVCVRVWGRGQAGWRRYRTNGAQVVAVVVVVVVVVAVPWRSWPWWWPAGGEWPSSGRRAAGRTFPSHFNRARALNRLSTIASVLTRYRPPPPPSCFDSGADCAPDCTDGRASPPPLPLPATARSLACSAVGRGRHAVVLPPRRMTASASDKDKDNDDGGTDDASHHHYYYYKVVLIDTEGFNARDIDALAECLLLELDALSVSVEDAHAGTPLEEPMFRQQQQQQHAADGSDDESKYWARSVVKVMLPAEASTESVLARMSAALGLARAPRYREQAELVDARRDWVAHVHESFQPIRIGRRLLVRFPWNSIDEHDAAEADADAEAEEEDDELGTDASQRRRPRRQRHVITLEPGWAFGTGEHATTQLCARWLEQHVTRGCSVLDYGSGSGVLLIYACMLGADARASLGVDIDRKANTVARENARRNGFGARADSERDGADGSAIAFVAPNEAAAEAARQPARRGGEFDLVVANILAEPLRALAPALARYTRCGGGIALSGMLCEQVERVSEAYRAWFDMVQGDVQDGWAVLHGVRR